MLPFITVFDFIELLNCKPLVHKTDSFEVFGRLSCSSKQFHCSQMHADTHTYTQTHTHSQLYPQGQFLQTAGRACSQSCSKWLHKSSLAHPRLNMYGTHQLWLCPQSKCVMKHLKATFSNLCKTDNLFSRLFKILQSNSRSTDA